MKYVEYVAKNRIVNDELLNKILDYNNILNLDLLNKSTYPYDYEYISEFIKKIDMHKNISIIGDYDCDGICATSIMYLFLKRLGKEVYYIIGNRMIDGYGMNENLINQAINNKSSLIITVDNGINAKEEVDYAKSKNIDVIVTDHHLSSGSFPDCLCFNPHYEDNISFKDVCGAFVAFSLVHAYFRFKNSIDKTFIKNLYELSALATIADVMPLYDINRVIVNNLVKSINYKKIENKGIKLLCEYFGFLKVQAISAIDISYTIIPVINASGRLDDASIVVDLFTGNESTTLIDEIIKINEKRKSLTNDAYSNIRIDSNENIQICYLDDVSEGLLGILSGKILNQTKKPTFVFTKSNDLVKGSGRSLENFDLHQAISNMDITYNSFGGHKRAVGISFSNMDDFYIFKKEVQNFVVPEAIFYYFTYNYNSFYDVYKTISSLEPLGEGIKIPYFLVSGEIKDIKVINGKHTSFRMEINKKMEKFIIFNSVLDSGKYNILFEIKKTNFGMQGQVYKIEKDIEF
ncbi:MAG: DHH family phosphoesterase [Acholeplasmatales bacterium]|nr:DHH family phosphoesterase [Acholeplasmatales bacterium]